MGLDTVELLVNVEKTFGISVPDREAEQIITVGDFYEVVWRHIGAKHSDQCKSQYLFYKLRTALHNSFTIPALQIKPAAAPETLFPKKHRRPLYQDFAESINFQLPVLVLSKPWSLLLDIFGWISIAGGTVTSLILYYFFNFTWWIFLVPVAGIFLTMLFSKLLDSKRILIREKTLREFIGEMLTMNYAKLIADSGNNRKEMEKIINQIIINKSGVDPEEVSAEKKIGDDLGIC